MSDQNPLARGKKNKDGIQINVAGYGQEDCFVKAGDTVHDGLTGKPVKILRIDEKDNCIGVWVDDPWVGGGRHPWEISPLIEIDSVRIKFKDE